MARTMLRLICKLFFIGILLSILSNGTRADPLPKVTAQAWLVADVSGNILEGSNTTDVRSIASITKLMTVMVVIDAQQDLSEVITKKLFNKNLTRMDLIDLAIVKSDNEASKILCEKYPGGYKNCIQAMNEKAKGLQMHNTSFSDPTGRMHDNVSTAQDLIKLVMAASSYQAIVDASKKGHLTYSTGKKNSLTFNNTNNLVGKGYEFIVTKTGFINKAGGCIVFMIDTVRGVRTVVLLGSKNTITRIPEAYLISTLY